MSVSLTVLRNRGQADRFKRLHQDDTRTPLGDGVAAALAAELKAVIDGEVRFDNGTRALYSTDGSNYRQAPIGVVLPRHIDDVQRTIDLARKYGAPVLSRGGGTSLAGQCCNVAVVIDFSKYMHDVIEIDAVKKLARVQPGSTCDHFRETAKKRAGLWFGPDPATHSRCTIGGMLGNNSCGAHSLMSKNHGLGVRMSDNTHALDILLYDGTRMHVGPTSPDELDQIIRAGGRRGEIYAGLKQIVDRYGDVIRTRFPKLERRVSGYNLDDLLPENGMNVARALVGSESTLVTILEATLHLIPAAQARSLVMLGFEDIHLASECGLDVLKFNPAACEGIDELLFDSIKKKGDQTANLALLPRGPAFILAEFDGPTKAEADALANRMIDHVKTLGPHAPLDYKLYADPQHEQMIWKVREGALASTAWIPGQPDAWEGWEDSAVPVQAVPQYLRELRALFRKHGYNPSIYGHLGQGCMHCRAQFDLYTQQGIDNYKRFADEAVELVVKHGGVASGEHGDGQSRGQYLPQMFGDELMQAFHDFKRLWDPDNRMNTGKLINLEGPVLRIDDNLRLGPDYAPPQPETHFAFAADQHSFARAALRCVGVGACRREKSGTMCPSYMVTREEKHSTRGRARMLFEMMNGEIIQDGWKSEEVKESLDLCLSCKGCKSDCPVNVDMATYKAEFLSHYYEGKVRPRHAYAFGWIHIWARLASLAPGVANLFTQLPGLGRLSKFAAGVHPARRMPAFAPQPFKSWFKTHRPKHPDGQPVVLFADTFNNYWHPDVSIAAVEVLEHAGCRVIVPTADMCCGRPLYDYGFLGMAKRWWTQLLGHLRPYYQAGIPMVVLEPSCWTSFQDELTNLFPADLDATRLKSLTFTLSDFLRNQVKDYQPPKLKRDALVHGHCHQKATDALGDQQFGKLRAEKDIFDKMGVSHRYPDAGCCGMAGAFGYEKEHHHYEVSVACGERVLLPEVRNAPLDTLIIADGFSCQEQVEQQTDRKALHLAQVLQMAIHEGEAGPTGVPEAAMARQREAEIKRSVVQGAVIIGVAAVVGVALWKLFGPSRRR
jgi:FAD/FMN-containing dehydrogenase/Fe-S oxidoreductase